MKILMLTAVLGRVGTWFRTFNLAAELVSRGHEVTMVKVSQTRRLVPERSVERGVFVVEMPRLWASNIMFHRGSRMPADILARIGMQMVGNYDVVHAFTHHLNALAPALVASRLGRGTVVLGDRDDLWTAGGLGGDGTQGGAIDRLNYRFNAWTERRMGPWLGTMTVVSGDLRDRELAAGTDPARIRKIVNGCPVDQIKPGDKAAARAVLGLPRDRRIALFVGVGQYDVDLIMEAIRHLKRAQPETAVPLTVLVGPHGELLRTMAAERGLADVVQTTDIISDEKLLAYLHAADVGLLPFADKPLNWARWPIKIGDYMAAGLPVVTNNVGEMGALVAKDQFGAVTLPNPAAFATGMADLISDQQRLGELAARARQAAERLSWAKVAAGLEQFYVEMGAPAS